MRQFSEEVSHELKTPLSLLRFHAEQILRDDAGQHADAAVEQIEEIARLNRFIDQMLFLSQAEVYSIALWSQTYRSAIIRRCVRGRCSGARGRFRSSLQRSVRGRGMVEIDESRFRQVLFNITTNAIKASPIGTEILA